jgi:hypothetical protein
VEKSRTEAEREKDEGKGSLQTRLACVLARFMIPFGARGDWGTRPLVTNQTCRMKKARVPLRHASRSDHDTKLPRHSYPSWWAKKYGAIHELPRIGGLCRERNTCISILDTAWLFFALSRLLSLASRHALPTLPAC